MTELLLPLLTALLGAALCAIGFMLWLLRGRRRQAPDEAAARIGQLQSELNMLASASVGMGQRLDRAIADLRSLRESLESLESRGTAGDGSYLQAIRMAERGKGVEELMEVFGVSRAEAELLRKLHPEQKAARH